MEKSVSRSRTLHQSDCSIISPASSLSLKSVLLHDWWLVKAESNCISVAGFASRERLGTRVFFSAPISRRIDAVTLETVDGITVTISGFTNRFQMIQSGFPLLICNRFNLGFPCDWENCVAQFYVEERTKRDASLEDSGLNSSSPSDTEANTCLASSFDKLPTTRLRGLVMHVPEDFENFIYDYTAGKVRDNAFEHSPEAVHSNQNDESTSAIPKSKVDETYTKCKKAKTKPMHNSRGVRTRRMRSLQNPRTKKEDNIPLKSSVNSKILRKRLEKTQLSPALCNRKNFEEVARALEGSSGSICHGQDTEHEEASVIPGVRRSSRLKIQKSYVGMAN